MDDIRLENNSDDINPFDSKSYAPAHNVPEYVNNAVNSIEQQSIDAQDLSQNSGKYYDKLDMDFDKVNSIKSIPKMKSKLQIILPVICALFIAVIGVFVFAYQLSDSVKYRKALNAIDNGSYVYAKSILSEIADYKDAKSKTIEVNYLILLEYIRTNGAIKGRDYVINKNLADDNLKHAIALTAKSDNTIIFEVKQTSMVGQIISNFLISPTDNIINIDASREIILTVLGNTGVSYESGKGKLDRSIYKYGDIAPIYDYSNVGTFHDMNTEDSFAKASSRALAKGIRFLEDLIKAPEIGLTMADFGFYAY